jgi:hypothetical protein
MDLTPEQIQQNYLDFLGCIDTYIASPRKERLLEYYKSIEDHLVTAPASIRESYHNCMPGGYLDHINRVTRAALELHNLWNGFREQGAGATYTVEELVFAAINHDLGKLGYAGKPGVLPNDNDWQVKNQGAKYKINQELSFSAVPDRTLFILQSQGIPVSENEYLGIKLHDGLYDESNKAYLISYSTEARLRTTLPIILHQADMLAARLEWERVWVPKLTSPNVNKPQNKPQASKFTSVDARKEAIAKLGKSNPAFLAALKNI